MKKIVIIEYLKFQDLKKGFPFENAYRSGYWNVMRHSPVLEQFLIDNKIAHKIIED